MTGEPGRPALDLSTPRTIHIVGVGGAGMSAIAAVLARMGHRVSGSDLSDSPTLERLRATRRRCTSRPRRRQPPAVRRRGDRVDRDRRVEPRGRRARELGVPVFTRAEALRAMVATRRTIAVAGSHGKTTTSSMLALVLREAGWHPSFVIGGDLNEVGTNAVVGRRRVARRRGRRERRHVPRARPRRRGRHQRRARPPRPLR